MARAKQKVCHPIVHRLGFFPMNTVEELRKLSKKAILLKEKGFLPNLDEKYTEQELIEPFIETLGYNLGFLAREVERQPSTPFATTNVKCDYAIKKDDTRIMLIEAKRASVFLGAANQLSDYFGREPEVWLGIFTNGIEYHFYSGDPDGVKKMDPQPFLVLNLLEFDEAIAETVSTFAKDQFDPNKVQELAQREKFKREWEPKIIDALRKELEEPSEEFFQLFLNKIDAEGEDLERLKPLVKKVANQVLKLPPSGATPPAYPGTLPPRSSDINESGIPIRFIDGGQIYEASLIQGGRVRLDDGIPYNPSGACIKLGRRPTYNGWIEWKYYDKQAKGELFIDNLREREDDDQIRRTGISIGWIPRQGPRQKPKYF